MLNEPSGLRYHPSNAGVPVWPEAFATESGSCACVSGAAPAAASTASPSDTVNRALIAGMVSLCLSDDPLGFAEQLPPIRLWGTLRKSQQRLGVLQPRVRILCQRRPRARQRGIDRFSPGDEQPDELAFRERIGRVPTYGVPNRARLFVGLVETYRPIDVDQRPDDGSR